MENSKVSLKIDVLVAEIGSTTTVVNAFHDINTNNPIFLGQGQAPTTVFEGGDVRNGLSGAIKDLANKLSVDDIEYNDMFATSSAAGGLKMTVHGLVYDMTVKAAKEAALGAGAVIRQITSGRIKRTDLNKIKEINPNIILIAGGVDYGERDTAIYNAEMIASMNLGIPVIYAGNVENQEEIRLIFEDTNYKLYITENVYPKIDLLNIEPTRRIIQSVFEEHITTAPGMKYIKEMVNGVYVNMKNIVEVIGKENLQSELSIDIDAVIENYPPIPKSKEEILFVERLTKEAVVKAMLRHSGKIRNIYGTTGKVKIAEGKDLTEVRYIVGTGGALTRLPSRIEILDNMLKYNKNNELLFPKEKTKILIDNDYIMASMGVLSKKYEEASLKLLLKSLNFEEERLCILG